MLWGWQFSDWLVKYNGPTAIELSSFTAVVQVDGGVKVAWETSAEWDHAGFNVYRGSSAEGALSQINGAIIASSGIQGQGASYQMVDRDVSVGTWWYTLEDVDIHGVSTLHGPISVALQTPTAITLAQGNSVSPFGNSFGSLLALFIVLLVLTHTVKSKEDPCR